MPWIRFPLHVAQLTNYHARLRAQMREDRIAIGRQDDSPLFMHLYHAILSCDGMTDAEGANAPSEIVEEFSHRPWHKNVKCRWDGDVLWLEADNDYDAHGRALLDEFRDAVTACFSTGGTLRFEIVSVGPVSIGA